MYGTRRAAFWDAESFPPPSVGLGCPFWRFGGWKTHPALGGNVAVPVWAQGGGEGMPAGKPSSALGC